MTKNVKMVTKSFIAGFMWRSKINNSDPFEMILKDAVEFWESQKAHTCSNIKLLFYIYAMYLLLFNFFNIISMNKFIIYIFIIIDGRKITNLSDGTIKFSLYFIHN